MKELRPNRVTMRQFSGGAERENKEENLSQDNLWDHPRFELSTSRIGEYIVNVMRDRFVVEFNFGS